MPNGVETVFLVGERTRDDHGDPTGTAPDPVEVQGCITWPRTAIEEGRGEIVIDGLNVYLPPGAPKPEAKGQVIARAKTWEVDGEPAVYLKNGTEKGTLVVLKTRGT